MSYNRNDNELKYLTTDICLDGSYRPVKISNEITGLLVKNNKIGTNQTPTAPEDIANKQYVDSQLYEVQSLDGLSDVSYSDGDLTIDSLDKIVADDFVVDSGASVELDSHNGNFIYKKAGTEFSSDNSAYAGMILGYTRIQNETAGTGNDLITIGTTMTVLETAQGTKASITFKTPPSENVEIEYMSQLKADSKYVQFGLSDNATYNRVGDKFEYEGSTYSIKFDETDINYVIVKWTVGASELASVGSSNTFWIGADSSSASSYVYHGIGRMGTNHGPPILIKATALPATLVTGE